LLLRWRNRRGVDSWRYGLLAGADAFPLFFGVAVMCLAPDCAERSDRHRNVGGELGVAGLLIGTASIRAIVRSLRGQMVSQRLRAVV
jgi:hypothetical protein